MGQMKLWLIVEGRSHDRAFYDQVLESHPGLADHDYEIKLAEDFQLDGKTAGGKEFALRLFDLWEENGALSQSDKDGRRSVIAVALDHDLDSLAGKKRDSEHVIYTSGMDVESEILRSSDLALAVRATYSLPLGSTRGVLDNATSYFSMMAEQYREWITLSAIAAACEYRGRYRFSQLPDGGSGDAVDERAAVNDVLEHACSRGVEEKIEEMEDQIVAIFERGDGWRLVKGRWFAKHISDFIKASIPEVTESGIPEATLAKAALAFLKPMSDCFLHYQKRIDQILPMSPT